jgi:MFS family permease
MLDGFDSAIYTYILTPAVMDLLAHSNRAVATAPVALYGGYFFSLFMLGWAFSMIWGWLADRIGRVQVMCLTILTYSVFTAACGLAPGLLLFGIFRFLAGFGIGGEWAAGVSLLHESAPERVRVRYAGWLHTATPTGQILAAFVSLLYPILGWRGLFLVGVLPALLTIYLRRSIPEPEK